MRKGPDADVPGIGASLCAGAGRGGGQAAGWAAFAPAKYAVGRD
jgi:hypothetical protein